MSYSEKAEVKKFTRGAVVRSVFLFLLNYVILLLLVAFFIFLNSLESGRETFNEFIVNHTNKIIYLVSCLFLLYMAIYMYYVFEDKEFLAAPKNILLLFSVLLMCIVINYFFSFFFNLYARPVAVLALLVLLLLGMRDAIFLNVIFALMMFSIDQFTNFVPTYVNTLTSTPLITFAAGMVAIFAGSRVKTRLRSFLVGFAISVPILLMALCLEYGRGKDLLYLMLFGLEAGVLSSVLFMAFLPFFEMVFNCVTPYRLRELTDHDAPLMRDLKEKAMGTFNHSIVVAHLAEACAIALNEDTALARAVAYYHDVGKLRQPEYFTENQAGYNPHNELSPELSVDIIRSHARDGYELIKSKRLPQILADVALQHHGTTPIKYFYARALKMTDGEVNIDDFSYPGPKPQTKIAAIVMIADASEAISRTLPERTPEKVDAAVRDLIEERMAMDQFDECDLTMKDLGTIKETIVRCLSGVYHNRVQYPKIKIKHTGVPVGEQ